MLKWSLLVFAKSHGVKIMMTLVPAKLDSSVRTFKLGAWCLVFKKLRAYKMLKSLIHVNLVAHAAVSLRLPFQILSHIALVEMEF